MLRIGQTAFVGLFLLLLCIQLSGLSCLEEWTVPSPADAVSQSSALNDECPCHFTFVSSPSINVRSSSLATRAVTPPFMTYAFDSRVLLFRPPALA